GTAEVESSLVAHAKVSEAAVVGYPHDIKGQGIYAYVTLMAGTEPTEELRKELVAWVRKQRWPIEYLVKIQFETLLPKTRARSWCILSARTSGRSHPPTPPSSLCNNLRPARSISCAAFLPRSPRSS